MSRYHPIETIINRGTSHSWKNLNGTGVTNTSRQLPEKRHIYWWCWGQLESWWTCAYQTTSRPVVPMTNPGAGTFVKEIALDSLGVSTCVSYSPHISYPSSYLYNWYPAPVTIMVSGRVGYINDYLNRRRPKRNDSARGRTMRKSHDWTTWTSGMGGDSFQASHEWWDSLIEFLTIYSFRDVSHYFKMHSLFSCVPLGMLKTVPHSIIKSIANMSNLWIFSGWTWYSFVQFAMAYPEWFWTAGWGS